MKAFWKTYLALVVVCALGAYAYFVDSKKPSAEEAKNKKEKVFTVDKEKVKEIAVTKSEGEPVRVVKDGSAWKLAAPNEAPADSAQVDSMISTLTTTEVVRVVAEKPESLATFGLDKPRMTVAVVADGAEPMQLQIGAKTPDEQNLYAKSAATARVFTIPSTVEESFDKKPFDLRDRKVLHVNRADIKTLDIEGPEGKYSLAAKDKDTWVITSPVKSLAGRWSVDGLLGNLESLQMDEIAAEDAKDLKPYGLDKPARTVVLGLQDGAARRLEIGTPIDASKQKFYAREASRNMVVQIPQALPSDLAKGLGELRAKRLLDIAAYEVSGIELVVDGQKRMFARSSNKDAEGVDNYKWKKTAPEVKDLETNTVQDALFQIGAVEVAQFVDKPSAPASYGFDTPALKVTLSQEGKPPAWIELARKDGAVYARRDGDEAVLKLDAKGGDLIEAFKKL